MGGGPKVPKDTSFADSEKRRKEEEARTRNQFLTQQKTRSRSGRGSTVLATDTEKTSLLGG